MSEEERVKKALEWLEKAEDDFDDAVFNLEDDRRETAGFLLHQAAEKALKALQIEDEGEYEYVHNLVELAGDTVPSRYREMLAELNPVYTGFRYPDIELENIENLSKLKEDVEEFLGWTRRQLKE